MPAEEQLARAFLSDHPEAAAALLEQRPTDEVAELIHSSTPEVGAAVIRRMTPGPAARCMEALDADAVAALVEHLSIGTVAALLRRASPTVGEAILERVPRRHASALRAVLRFPAGTAGALMDPRVLALPNDTSAGEAVERLRASVQHAIYYLYVVDRDQKLCGVLNVRELLLAAPEDRIASVMHAPVARLDASAGISEIIGHPGWRVYHAMPVVDEDGSFLGAIRYETLRDLEGASGRSRSSRPASATLGVAEMVWVGLAGMFDGLVRVDTRPERRDTGR